MAKYEIYKGSTDVTLDVFIQDSTSTTGAGKTGLTYTGISAAYNRIRSSAVGITMATQTVTGAHSDGGFVEINADTMPGHYRFDAPDELFLTGSNAVSVNLKGSGMANLPLEIELLGVNLQDPVRGGMTALPNANAEASGGLPTLSAAQASNGTIQANVHRWLTGTPNALQSGRVDSYIGAIANGVIAAASFAANALDAVWSTASRTLTAFDNSFKTGYALSSAGVQAIWDALTSALTTVGSIGKLLVDNINATIGSRATQTSVDDGIQDIQNDILNLETLIDALPDAAETATAVWEDGNWATYNSEGTPALELRSMIRSKVIGQATISVVSTQTSFTLNDIGYLSENNDTYNGCVIVIYSQSNPPRNKCVGIVADYVAATRTITLLSDPAIFTITSGDSVFMLTDKTLKAEQYTAPDNSTISTINTKIGTPVATVSTDIAGVQSDTNDIQTRIPTTLSGGRMRADTLAINGEATAAARLQADYSDETGNTIVMRRGTVVDSDGTYIELDSNASTEDDFYTGMLIRIEGNVAGLRMITAYNGTSKQATLDKVFDTSPSDPDTFIIYPTRGPKVDLTLRTTDVNSATLASLAIKKNTAFTNFEFFMVSSTDHRTGKTGLTITSTRSIDGGAFASTTNTATEIGGGFYKINLSAADLNGTMITFKMTGTLADDLQFSIVTQP